MLDQDFRPHLRESGIFNALVLQFPDHAPFLEAIELADADDAPRLVYADWLAECGLESMETYVRTSVEMNAIARTDRLIWHEADWKEKSPRFAELCDRRIKATLAFDYMAGFPYAWTLLVRGPAERVLTEDGF